MKCFNQARWAALCASASATKELVHRFGDLRAHYSQPHLHYHNSRHIDDCLHQFDGIRAHAQNPPALEFAIWFHDVIYDPRASDNEEQSARFAIDCLKVPAGPLAQLVSDLILTTKTHRSGHTPDAPWLIDIDLSILGQSADRFAEYETGIRAEYSWVPIHLYREKRAAILRSFLQRERLYSTPFFYERYEAAARRNIAKSISDLEQGPE